MTVTLIKSVDELVQRGITQSCGGASSYKVNKKNYRVMFMNGNNYGNGIFATVSESDVKYLSTFPMHSKHNRRVHKGMTGCVMPSHAIKNEWLIVFSEEGTGKDIAELCVSREDFKVIK